MTLANFMVKQDQMLGAPRGMFIFPMFLFLLSTFTPVPFSWLIYFSMAYFWDLSLRSEKLWEKSQTPAYRFSFVKMVFQIHLTLKRLPLLFRAEWAVRVLAPTLMGAIYTIVISEWAFVPCLLGAIVSEILYASLISLSHTSRFYK